jgi:transcriptional regulator with XRE-family HTH domain
MSAVQFSDEIKSLLALGLTEGQIAKHVHVSQSTVSRWVAGMDARRANADAVRQLAKELSAKSPVNSAPGAEACTTDIEGDALHYFLEAAIDVALATRESIDPDPKAISRLALEFARNEPDQNLSQRPSAQMIIKVRDRYVQLSRTVKQRKPRDKP